MPQKFPCHQGSADLIGMHPVPGQVRGVPVPEISVENRLHVHKNQPVFFRQLLGHRAQLIHSFAHGVFPVWLQEKGRHQEYLFYKRFGEIAVQEIYQRKGIHVCTNVDFYSGLVYNMLNIPSDLYTLLFVVARTVGWIAHNVENKLYSNRIIRPATKYVGTLKDYQPVEKRK